MTQSVELLLDDRSDAQIRAQWASLVTADLPSQGRHPHPANRPHVTVIARDLVDDARAAELVELLQVLPLPVRLDGLTFFGHRRLVLVRSMAASRALLDLQEAVAVLLGGGDHFGPGEWMPHVTLARRLTSEQAGDALGVLGSGRPLDGQVVGCRRWDGEARREWRIC